MATKTSGINQARIKIAKPDIISFFNGLSENVFNRSQIGQFLSQNRDFWRLSRTSVDAFIEFLLKESKLKRIELKFPNWKKNLYSWGDVSLYKTAISVRPESYLSHYTALFLHGLTEQIPRTIYVNQEQSPKPTGNAQLSQEKIDFAFRQRPRVTTNIAECSGHKIYLLAGKWTEQLGVTQILTGEGENLRLTGLERTLVDIAVRPVYAGGVFEVLKAYQLASGNVSVNRLAATLKQLNYIYPYHQAIGFHLERSGAYKESQVRLLRKPGFNFDFYLAHNMGEVEYSAEWRLFYPKGL